MNRKIINLLTICKKAGKLVMGSDIVKDGIRNGTVQCVICTSDLSPKSLKEIRFAAEADRIPVITSDTEMNDIWEALGRKSGIVGICDAGFAKQFEKLSQ